MNYNPFANCAKLKNITINSDLYVYESGLLMPKARDSILYISNSYIENLDTFSIPEGIINFTMNISKFKNIKTINIPKSLKYIRESFFSRYNRENKCSRRK